MRADVGHQVSVVENKKLRELLTALEEVEIRPWFTELNRRTGIPITTVWDRWKRLERDYEVTAVIQIRRRLAGWNE